MRFASRTALIGVLALSSAAAVAQPALAHAKPKPTASTTSVAAVSATAPVRIVSATSAVSDSQLRSFKPDAGYAVGGRLTQTTHSIARTASQGLYQHARVGVSGYNVPVAGPGTYFVDMFTSETEGANPGQRVWSVNAEGHRVASNVDAARDIGPDTAWHVMFAVPVTDGVLNLTIAPQAGTPMVDAVEIDYEKAAKSPSTLLDENFDGPAGTPPNSAVWSYNTGGGGWGNNELETYTSRTSNAALDGAGNLDIVARQETYTGTDGITRNYTSARLNTSDKFSFQYGSAEARMRLPGGQGTLPAFWALGTDLPTVGWPVCGEMDVMENLGSEPSTVHGTIVGGSSTGTPWLTGFAGSAATSVSSGYHTYGLVWGPTGISMTLDGRTYMSTSASDQLTTSWWNFTHPFYLILDLAIGGNWPGAPDSTTPFPAVMSVDYVHVTG